MLKTTILYVIAAIAGAILLRRLQLRLQLSAAKHRSLTGHSRMARRNLEWALTNRDVLQQLPGASLIARSDWPG